MKKLLIILIVLSGCYRNSDSIDAMVAIQISDRNGLTETISHPDRLSVFEETDFLSSQPYQKVLRVYRQDGKNHSKITTYHPNGTVWQYLEAEEMRAHGAYKEWHANGVLKVEATVIGGTADVTGSSQRDWLFDGVCRVWNEKGVLVAEILYEKGNLEGTTKHFYPTGELKKELLYVNHMLDGDAIEYYPNGSIKSQSHFEKDIQNGISLGIFETGAVAWQETWKQGRIWQAAYFDKMGGSLTSVNEGEGFRVVYDEGGIKQYIQIKNGLEEGLVKNFNKEGQLQSVVEIKNGKKQGEETIYFPNMKPKIQIQWVENAIHGIAKTWYDNGQIRSEREYNRNKKMGSSFAWYKNGSIMLVEEYEDDNLVKGSYYKKGSKEPVSTIQNGTGIAHLFDEEGILLRKVHYQKGRAQDPEN